MNTKYLMTAAALALGAAGIILSFLPQEILAAVQETPSPARTIPVQMLGALYYAFAMVNWLSKDSLMGGIYGRPIVIGNLTHFLIGTLVLLKSLSVAAAPPLIIAAMVYGCFTILFTIVLYKTPAAKIN